MAAATANSKVYEIITEKIIDQLKAGVIAWHKPWRGGDAPMNLKTKKPYRGINPFLLGCQAYTSPYWLTHKQAVESTGEQTCLKGQKSTIIIFWKFLEQKNGKRNAAGKLPQFPMLRYYNVFNVEQVVGFVKGEHYPAPVVALPDFNPIESAERIIADFAVANPTLNILEPKGHQACYVLSADEIRMPPRESFETEQSYYATLFHESGHATRHKSRLDRALDSGRRGDTSYACEELVAEFTAAFLCGHAGISPALNQASGNESFSDSAAYIAHWLQRLGDDPKLVVSAGGKAQKAADYILGINWDEKSKKVENEEAVAV